MGITRGARALPLVVVSLAFPSLLACGGPRRLPETGAAPQPPGGTKDYAQPLTIKEDAKKPHQAVILGTDERNGSTIIPLSTAPVKGLVDAMWVRTGGGTVPSGGSTPVKLVTGPNTDGGVQVGVFEELAGGTGSQWRAGVWISAFVAATALNKDLTDFTFTATSGGYIDGASASGLMAGGFLATMTGADIDPTATMTGIINPDGTIGPVSGIPEKFKGSMEKGKKKLGYPIGSRWARSAATGKLVDLVELAREGGAEAVEVANIQGAYKLLTGKTLPEPVPVPEADMAVDRDTSAALDAKYKEWQDRLAGEWSTLIQLGQAGRLPLIITAMAGQAQRLAVQAEQLHKKGLAGAAYSRMLQAWVYAASATDAYDILSKVQAGDISAAVASMNQLDKLDQGTAEVFKKIGSFKPTTMGGHLLMMGAFQAALRGWGFKVFAADNVAKTRSFLASLSMVSRADLGSPAVAEEVAKIVAPTVLLIGKTVAETALAVQRMEFESEKTVNYMCSLPNLRRLSTSFESASAAGMNYFDTLLVQPIAAQAGVSVEFARHRLSMREPGYLVAFMMSRLAVASDGLPAELKKEWGESSLPWRIMSLAASEHSYFDAASLIAKYYSLDVKTDEITGRIVGVEHEKAFVHMLASAERAARASARAARIATGSIPVQAKLAYQLAGVVREGDMHDKLEALLGYWNASAYSQVAVMLARN